MLNAMSKWLLTIWVMKNALASSPKSVMVHQTGVIFTEAVNTILSERDTHFDVKLFFPFPSFIYNVSNPCYSKIAMNSYNVLNKKTITEILKNFETSMLGTISVDKVQNFLDKSIGNNHRNRRSFEYVHDGFFTLSGWVEQKLSDVDRTLKDTTSMFNNRLDGQSIMLKNEHRNIVSLTHIMCRNKIALEKEMLNSQIELEYFVVLQQISQQLALLEFGKLPVAMNDSILVKLCEAHFRPYSESPFCTSVPIRNLFKTKMKIAYLDSSSNSFILSFTVSMPDTSTKNHRVYKIYSVPFFAHHVLSRKRNLPVDNGIKNQYYTIDVSTKYFAIRTDKNNGSSKGVAYDTCNTENGITICSQVSRQSDRHCLLATFQENQRNMDHFCTYKVEQSNTSCFALVTDYGLVVSSNSLVTTHQSKVKNQKPQVFKKTITHRKGIFLIPNNPSVLSSVYCADELYFTDIATNLQNISIFIQKPNILNLTLSSSHEFLLLKNSLDNAHDQIRSMDKYNNSTDHHFNSIYQTISNLSIWKLVCLVVTCTVSLFCFVAFLKMMYWIYSKCLRCKSKRNINYDA